MVVVPRRRNHNRGKGGPIDTRVPRNSDTRHVDIAERCNEKHIFLVGAHPVDIRGNNRNRHGGGA